MAQVVHGWASSFAQVEGQLLDDFVGVGAVGLVDLAGDAVDLDGQGAVFASYVGGTVGDDGERALLLCAGFSAGEARLCALVDFVDQYRQVSTDAAQVSRDGLFINGHAVGSRALLDQLGLQLERGRGDVGALVALLPRSLHLGRTVFDLGPPEPVDQGFFLRRDLPGVFVRDDSALHILLATLLEPVQGRFAHGHSVVHDSAANLADHSPGGAGDPATQAAVLFGAFEEGVQVGVVLQVLGCFLNRSTLLRGIRRAEDPVRQLTGFGVALRGHLGQALVQQTDALLVVLGEPRLELRTFDVHTFRRGPRQDGALVERFFHAVIDLAGLGAQVLHQRAGAAVALLVRGQVDDLALARAEQAFGLLACRVDAALQCAAVVGLLGHVENLPSLGTDEVSGLASLIAPEVRGLASTVVARVCIGACGNQWTAADSTAQTFV